MKWLLRGLAALFLLALVVGVAGFFWLRSSLPELDGRQVVQGLSAPVEIVRDRNAVPHIFAQSLPDAMFALGYAHAQDRLWQMEMNRRIGAGRLAEVVGAPAANIDRFLRTLGFYRDAEQGIERLDARTRAVFEAYADGVNAYLDARQGPLPPEFLILGHEPEPWRAADSLVWLKVMALDLAGNWNEELLRFQLALKLKPEQIDDLWASYDGADRQGVSVLQSLYRTVPDETVRRLAERGYPAPSEGAGSNNWVVDGSRTATGKPLLANDPHLGLSSPSVWYFAHLSWPEGELVGTTFPGYPGIILGRNEHLAWSFTNTNGDVQDLYIERLDPADPSRYLTPEGPRPFTLRKERIVVKDAPDITLEVRSTRHGPVISDAYTDAAEAITADYVLALRWTALTADDMTASAGLRMQTATSAEALRAAMRDYHSPQQSVVYADTEGNIGFYAPGRVPLRQPENQVVGFMPQPGWDGAYDWSGYIPFGELPHVENPPEGMIATANHKIVGSDYPYHITYDWADSYRIDRIFSLLRSREKHSVESFKAMQADTVSLMVREFLPRMLQAVAASELGREAHRRLRAWDGEMAAHRPEPLIFAAWYRELTRLVYADELGALFGATWSKRARFMRRVLLGNGDAWCDDVLSEQKEDCNLQLTRALELAVNWIAARYGEDPDKWRWGDAHPAVGAHRPLSRVPVLAGLFEIRVPSPGGTYTVNAGHHRITDPENPFANVHAASLRAIYDLEDLDRSLFIHSTGQSGNPLSSYYRNFSELWASGEYITIPTRRSEIEAGALGILQLAPQG